MRFLKNNKCWDEQSYNNLYENNKSWMCEIGQIPKKYPKFCFRNIHPNNMNYYWERIDAENAYNDAEQKLIKNTDKEKYKRLKSENKLNKIITLDNKIPPIDLDLYYPK